jgi:alpha-glucosidase
LLLGEVWLLDSDLVLPYVDTDQLDLAFNFPFAMAPWNARAMAALIERVESRWTEAWPCYHLSNHDMPRIRTRYGPEALPAAVVLLLTLRGTVQLYQGDEIGMGDGPVPPERQRDEVGRDGCRTPMHWDGTVNAGFCPPDADPWLPVAPDHDRVNVEAEAADPDSLLNLYRRLIDLRRHSSSLLHGSFGLVGATRDVLLFRRDGGDERFLVAVGFGGVDVTFHAPPGRVEVATARRREGEHVGGTCLLGPWEALVVRLDETE